MATKPKIALMTYAIDGRHAKGTALYARKLVEGLLKNKEYDFFLVHYEKSNDPIYALGAKEIIMPAVPAFFFWKRFIRQLLFFWRYRHERFAIVHWFQPRVYPFFWWAPAEKILITVHGAGDIVAKNKFNLSKLVFNWTLILFNHKASALIAASQYGKEEIVKYYKATNDNVVPIYLGVDFKRLSIPKKEIILDVSRHVPHKNIPTLLKAYARMREKFPERKEQLVIVGIQYADTPKAPHDVTFIPYVDDLNETYAEAKLFVFPSLNEGFGLPVLESMASGTPVITSNTTSLPEIAGDAAMLVNPLDVDKIAEAMNTILSNRTLYTEMVEKGLQRAKEFSWNKMVSETTALYQHLLKVRVI
jgi:glycosyltransferase involved in cell wall biosynthesis